MMILLVTVFFLFNGQEKNYGNCTIKQKAITEDADRKYIGFELNQNYYDIFFKKNR